MKTTFPTEVSPDQVLPDSLVEELTSDGLLPECDIDYSKARPNRFAVREAAAQTVKLDADVAAVFKTDEAVNAILRALIQAMPQSVRRETGERCAEYNELTDFGETYEQASMADITDWGRVNCLGDVVRNVTLASTDR